MQKDLISQLIVSLALRLNEQKEGLVSEIWLPKEDIAKIKRTTSIFSFEKLLEMAQFELNNVENLVRRQYLSKLILSITYQNKHLYSNESSLISFYNNVFDTDLYKVTLKDLVLINNELKELENSTGIKRLAALEALKVPKRELLPLFKKELSKAKKSLPKYLQVSGEIQLELVDTAPWGAFNSHIGVKESLISLNTSSGLTTLDLKHLAYHEVYGGHHTELSLKDTLLTVNNWRENGLILVYSPRTYISEGIAEIALDTFGGSPKLNPQEIICQKYENLWYALMNHVVFKVYEDNSSKNEIRRFLEPYELGELGVSNMVNFVFDPIFGKYGAVYYSAKKFMSSKYNFASNKKTFLHRIYTESVTASML